MVDFFLSFLDYQCSAMTASSSCPVGLSESSFEMICVFFRKPRFQIGVKFIHIDIVAEEFHNNVTAAVALQGNLRDVLKQVG